jgi:hypothetical protein
VGRMIDPSDAVIVMQGPHDELSRVAARLGERGVEAEVVCPDAGSGSS